MSLLYLLLLWFNRSRCLCFFGPRTSAEDAEGRDVFVVIRQDYKYGHSGNNNELLCLLD